MNSLKLGLIGCGNFGQFCLGVYSKIEKIKIVAVADIDHELAKKTAIEYAANVFTNPKDLIKNQNIDLIHIATPPFLHYQFGFEALQNDKHVICEKPLALSLADANEMISSDKKNNKIIPVNFVLRYVPIVDIVKHIIESNILGMPLHASFENFAADENLDENHWFWDIEKSGGIFVEHGVHFFDLYRYWFGEADVIYAHAETRPNSKQQDRVSCLLRHHSGTITTHYHGFDQPMCMDRQLHRLLFETGDIAIKGWIPEALTVNAIVDDEKMKELQAIIPNGEVIVTETFENSRQIMKGREKEIIATNKIQINFKSSEAKQILYSNAFKNLIFDQINYIQNQNHQRVISEKNGLSALELAIKAKQLSEKV